MTAAGYCAHVGQKAYIWPRVAEYRRPMFDRIRSATLFGLHQTAIAIGISLFPVAVFARDQLGINVPVHRLVETTGEAYENAEK